MSSEDEFLEVRFVVSVYYSYVSKIVIWALVLARPLELSDSNP